MGGGQILRVTNCRHTRNSIGDDEVGERRAPGAHGAVMRAPRVAGPSDTMLRYGCVLTVSICHSCCLRDSSNAPSRSQILIGELASHVWCSRAATGPHSSSKDCAGCCLQLTEVHPLLWVEIGVVWTWHSWAWHSSCTPVCPPPTPPWLPRKWPQRHDDTPQSTVSARERGGCGAESCLDAGIRLQQASMAWLGGAETAPAIPPCGLEAARTEKTAPLAGAGVRGFVVAMAKSWTFVSAFVACGRLERLLIR